MQQGITDASRKWWALAAVGSGTFMSTVDGSIVNIALTTIQRSFGATLGQVEWVVLAYLLGIACLLPTMGRLGDMIGRRRVYMAGFILFAVASVLCGIAWDINSLTGFRVAQAIGAAMIQSMGVALLVQAFPSNERGLAIGYNATIISVGVASGPVIGGLLIEQFNWQSIFFVNIPVSIVGLIISQRALVDDAKRSTQRFDLVGAFSLGASLVAILYALTEGQHVGFDLPMIQGLFSAGLLGLIFFVWWELRTPAPMIDMSFFKVRDFSIGLIQTYMITLPQQFNYVLLPIFLQTVAGYDARTTGLTIIVVPIITTFLSSISGRLSDKYGPNWIAPIGVVIWTIGLVLMSGLSDKPSLWDVAARVAFIAVGITLFFTPINSSILGSLPKERSGIANGIMSVTRTMGQISGISIGALIWTWQVDSLSGQHYEIIADAPHAILHQGYSTTMLVGAAICLAGLIPALFRLRKRDNAVAA